jgi:hypothetical protein
MKTFVCISVLLFILSCKAADQETEFEIPNLQKNINAFIKSKRCFNKPSNLLRVNLGIRNDSLQLEIADTYPNIKAEKFSFDTTLYGSRIIFTGENIKGFSKKVPSDFPPDIVKALEVKPDLLYEEYTAWLYVYRKGELIYQERPCAD